MTNQTAFLDMLAISEGTSIVIGSDNGYNVLVGGALFHSYEDHPRIIVDLGEGLYSSAAGRYQILERYFDAYKALLNLPDFSPTSQDAIALQQIKECGAIPDINAGNFDTAISKVAHIWASLPGSNYDQHENSLDILRTLYVNAGGTLNSIDTQTLEA